MRVIIHQSELRGTVEAPPSKSITHRTLICSALAEGKSRIRSPLIAEDTQATSRILQTLGVEISEEPNLWEVSGGHLQEPTESLFCGESGTTLRLSTAVCALVNGECRLTGGPSLSRRPVGDLVDGLSQLGVECESKGGFPPVTVRGKGRIEGGEAAIRGDISSQFVSGLLLIAPFGSNATSIRLTTQLESKPYVTMTMDVQRRFGVVVQASDDLSAYQIGSQCYRPTEITVEGDWSSAAYLLAAGVLAGEVTVKNLDPRSSQADKAIVDILEGMGASVLHRQGSISIQKTALSGIELDLSDSPDLFPVTASLCSAASGNSVLRGLRRLRFKESDRVKAMVEGLRNMGVRAREETNSVWIEGERPKGGVINPHNDHRIAMALSLLGLIANRETVILDSECVSKSYPEFWRDLACIGGDLRRLNDE